MPNIINITEHLGRPLIGSVNISKGLSDAGAYGVCIEEVWQPSMLLLAFLNVITIVAMMILHKKGKPEKADRLINILFLVNVFALTMNVVIALGFKFLPV